MRRSALAVALSTAALSTAVAATPAFALPAPWSSPTLVGPSGLDPQVSMGAGGDTTIALRNSADRSLVVRDHPAGGTWDAPTVLSTTGRQLSVWDVATSPADDAAVAIWNEQTPVVDPHGPPGMPGMPGPTNIMVAARAAGGSWDTPQALTPIGGDTMLAPAVALAADGRAVAIWFNRGDRSEYASVRAADGTWGTPQVIGTGSSTSSVNQATVALRGDGSAIAVWQRDGVLESAILHGSTWSSITQLGSGSSMQLGVADDGTAVLGYVGAPASDKVLTLSPGDVWSSPLTLSPGGADNYYAPALSIAPDGTGVMAWSQFDSPSYNRYAARRAADGTWTTAALLGTGTSESPGATAFDGGTSAVAYQSNTSPYPMSSTFFGADGWSSPFAISGSGSGSTPSLAGDGQGSAVVVYVENGSTAKVAFHDGSGPSLRELTVPADGTTGTPVATSVDPRDAVSDLGDTTWDFGDGSAIETGTSASHTYSAAGTYTVTVNAKDAPGNETVATRTITITAHAAPQTPTDEPTPADSTPVVPAPTTAPAPSQTHAPAAPVPAKPAAPVIQLAHTQKLATLLARREIRTTVAAQQAGKLTVTASVSKAAAKALGLKTTRLATKTVKVQAGASVPVSLRLSNRARARAAKLKSLAVTLTIIHTEADGTTSTTTTLLTARG